MGRRRRKRSDEVGDARENKALTIGKHVGVDGVVVGERCECCPSREQIGVLEMEGRQFAHNAIRDARQQVIWHYGRTGGLPFPIPRSAHGSGYWKWKAASSPIMP